VDNSTFISPENANTIIKRELENDEMGTNSPLQFQMPTTSSAALNLNVGNGVQQNGFHEFLAYYDTSTVQNVDGLITKNKLTEQSGRSISAGMDLEDEERGGGGYGAR
jgi:hypothetical protein